MKPSAGLAEIQANSYPMTIPAVPAPVPPPRKNRSIIYIDGFNFYYGLLENRPEFKWINYRRLAELLRPDDDILNVRLFTAEVDRGKPISAKRDRQHRLWQALATEPKIKVILGKFSYRERTCHVESCFRPEAERKYRALEEKQSDVNLAVALIRDVINVKPDIVVIISGDIDLLPILDLAMELDKRVRPAIFNPTTEEMLKKRRKDEFGTYVDAVRPISDKYLRMAQFPSRVTLKNGGFVDRPGLWPAP